MFNNSMYGYPQPMAMNNPYQSRLNALQSDFVQKQDIIRVNGKNGAEMINLLPNGSVLALDENAPIVWLVQADGAGYKTVTPYSITPYQADPTPDYNSLEARIKRLESLINEQSDNANAKSSIANKTTDAE